MVDLPSLISDFITNFLSNFALDLITFILLLRIESYFGIYEMIKRFLFLTFRKIHVILSVDYDSNIEICDLIDIIKRHFKNSYGKSSIDVKYVNEASFEFFVNKEFYITIEKNVTDVLTFRTSKITSTRKEIETDVRTFLDTLRDIENDVMNHNNIFNAKSFSISLNVPYVGTYMKFYAPKGLRIKKYMVELDEITDSKPNHLNSTKYSIQLEGDIININSNYRDKITELIDKFV